MNRRIQTDTLASSVGIEEKAWNGRKRAVFSLSGAMVLILFIIVGGIWSGDGAITTSLDEVNLPPSVAHLFGTDWLGRDMLARTLQGLTLSIGVGLLGSISSVIIATVLGLMSAVLGKTADAIISWLIDLFLSVPHMVMLILISFVSGGGMKGVVLGMALTHWPSLARVIRAEVLQLTNADYVLASRKLGRSRMWIATRHLWPHVLPQLLVGLLLLFPHAVLHEASLTFLGLGLSPHQPAIGIILSESMRYLSTGMWWLAVFPGLGLLLVVRAFDILGNRLQQLIHPKHSRE